MSRRVAPHAPLYTQIVDSAVRWCADDAFDEPPVLPDAILEAAARTLEPDSEQRRANLLMRFCQEGAVADARTLLRADELRALARAVRALHDVAASTGRAIAKRWREAERAATQTTALAANVAASSASVAATAAGGATAAGAKRRRTASMAPSLFEAMRARLDKAGAGGASADDDADTSSETSSDESDAA